jgi:hypothetical protein
MADESAPPTGPDARQAPLPPTGLDRRLASMTSRNTFMALQMSATLCATLGGLIFYMFLVSLRVNNILALVLGLGFALLSRRAALTLMGEWLVARARGRQNTDRADTQGGSGSSR